MEKLVRVSCELPFGVVVKAGGKSLFAMEAMDEIVERAFGSSSSKLRPMTSVESTLRSNLPIRLELEIPEELVDKAGLALLMMAKELIE